jgi:hypothetical protein
LKNYLVIPGYFLVIAMLSLSWLPAKPVRVKENTYRSSPSSPVSSTISPIEDVPALYLSLKLEEKGLSRQAFEYACKGYLRLLKKNRIKRDAYLVICDFSQSSSKKRLYLVDVENGEVVLNTYVAHGKNSGGEFANRFSNKLQSLQSSLGFYVTENTYYGEHGLSLRMKGLEPGYNDQAFRRRVVIHGADYIGDSWLAKNDYMGRSFGCPAIPKNESNHIINTIKNGSCIFIYHPSKSYLKGSKILNG